MEFGLVPPEHWHQPDWIDEEKATAARNDMVEHNIIYGGSVSYRNMCRYNSGVRCDSFLGCSTDAIFKISSVLLQASFSDEIQVVLAHRVRELHIF